MTTQQYARKDWGRTRWMMNNEIYYDIRPTPFGAWYLLNSHPDDNGYSNLLFHRKRWTTDSVTRRWETQFRDWWDE